MNTHYVANLSLGSLLVLVLILMRVGHRFRHPSISLSLGAALGALFFIFTLGVQILIPTEIGWLMRSHDWQTHFLGWHIFRNEPWHWPLGQLDGFWYPVGTSIGYTDSIPLLAFIFKPWHSLLPADFQYLGLWLFTCFILQGIFAALLMRLLTAHIWVQTLGILFWVLNPILLNRIAHPALCSHWLLLAGLWLYFKPWQNAHQALSHWFVITALSAWIHPYITVMVLGLALAFYGRWGLVERRLSMSQASIHLLILVSSVLVLWWSVGYFLLTDKQDMQAQALGHYSMNLLSLVNPMGWSAVLPDIPLATEGQYEGFNYLGLGLLLMAWWAVYEAIQRPIRWSQLKPVLPLMIVSLGLTLLALSNRITLGSQQLFALEHEWLTHLAAFQSTGRFFWPVNYALILFIIALLVRRNRPRRAVLYLSLGLSIQLFDFYPKISAHYQVHQQPEYYLWDNPLKSDIWEFAAQYYRHITLLPPYACDEPAAPYAPFAYLAGHHGMTLNSGYLARFNGAQTRQYCQQLMQAIQHGQVEADHLYIVHPRYLTLFQTTAQHPLSCASIDSYNACVSKASYLKWQADFSQS